MNQTFVLGNMFFSLFLRISSRVDKLYSLKQKECLTALDEKSSVFLTVNLIEILHVSTYGNYSYIYKVKKNGRGYCPAASRRAPRPLDLHLRALGLVPTWTGTGEGSSSHTFFITYSARGGSCD